jgi:hypothetical protein
VDLAALANLPQLRFLWCLNVAVTPAVEGQSCLPSSLKELHVLAREVSPGWWGHLAGCPQLTRLHIEYEALEQYAACHPSHVTRAVAQACPQLQQLQYGVREGMKRLRFRKQAPGGSVEAVPHTCWDLPEEAAALTALTQLLTPSACCLRVSTDSSWWLLGRLKKLSVVDVIQVDALPPSRLRLPWTVMSAKVSQSLGAEPLQLLSSCEQLEEFSLRVELRPQPQSVQPPPPHQQQQQQQQQEERSSARTFNAIQDKAQVGVAPTSDCLLRWMFGYAEAALHCPRRLPDCTAVVAEPCPTPKYASQTVQFKYCSTRHTSNLATCVHVAGHPCGGWETAWPSIDIHC